MTGKDVILFILNHNLVDTKIDGYALNELFLTVEKAAVKFGIGTNSLKDMIRIGLIDCVEFDGEIYIYKDVVLPTSTVKRR